MNGFKWEFNHPLISWIARTCFYTAILLGLVVIYGFSAAHTGTFIYSDF
ncbi:MAG: D-Ala-teichoic acid biosynthesis protein [Sporolactobacillus laevolacticus]|jgi:hypothetical protein|nr:D-Ala-teichoic acid biosynthesis protein [Sporolactobacillus laevolacticus]